MNPTLTLDITLPQQKANNMIPLLSGPEFMRIILEEDPLGDIMRLSPATPNMRTVWARCIVRGETGGERTMDEGPPKGLFPGSRTIFRPEKPAICETPSRLGDFRLGDKTSVDSANKRETKSFQITLQNDIKAKGLGWMDLKNRLGRNRHENLATNELMKNNKKKNTLAC